MGHRRASALMSAMLILGLVTLVSVGTLRRFTAWQVAYQVRLVSERQQLATAIARWQAAPGPAEPPEATAPLPPPVAGTEQPAQAVLPNPKVPWP